MTKEEMSNIILQKLEIKREQMKTLNHPRWCYSHEHMKYIIVLDEKSRNILSERLQSCDPSVPEITIRYGEIFLDFSKFENVPISSLEEMGWKIKTGTWLRKRAVEDLRRREEIV